MDSALFSTLVSIEKTWADYVSGTAFIWEVIHVQVLDTPGGIVNLFVILWYYQSRLDETFLRVVRKKAEGP